MRRQYIIGRPMMRHMAAWRPQQCPRSVNRLLAPKGPKGSAARLSGTGSNQRATDWEGIRASGPPIRLPYGFAEQQEFHCLGNVQGHRRDPCVDR
jgi:hypothetical protein